MVRCGASRRVSRANPSPASSFSRTACNCLSSLETWLRPTHRIRGLLIEGKQPVPLTSISKGSITCAARSTAEQTPWIFGRGTSPKNLSVRWIFDGFTQLTSAPACFNFSCNCSIPSRIAPGMSTQTKVRIISLPTLASRLPGSVIEAFFIVLKSKFRR